MPCTACVMRSDTSLVKVCNISMPLAHARPTMFYIPVVKRFTYTNWHFNQLGKRLNTGKGKGNGCIWYPVRGGKQKEGEIKSKKKRERDKGKQKREKRNRELPTVITSVMNYYRGVSLSEQHTDLLRAKQDLSHRSRYFDESSPEIAMQVSHTYANNYSQCDYICIN